MPTSKYFAVGHANGDLALVVERTGEPNLLGTPGYVINGAWHGIFGEEEVFVEYTERTYPGCILWEGNKIKRNGDYGFTYVQKMINESKG